MGQKSRKPLEVDEAMRALWRKVLPRLAEVFGEPFPDLLAEPPKIKLH